MSLWHREPRAVYRVYDEDHYLSASDTQTGEYAGVDYLRGPDADDGEQVGTGRESHAPDSGSGQIDAGYVEHSGVSPATHGSDSREVFGAGPRRGRQGRVLALTVLCVVAASASGLVAFEVSHRSGSAPSAVRRAPARPLRSVASGSNVPISRTSTSSSSVSSELSSPSLQRRAGRSAAVLTVHARRVWAISSPAARSVPLAAGAERYVGESSFEPAVQVNREFGFER